MRKIVLFCLLFLCAPVVMAETFMLKSGKVIDGDIIEVGSDFVRIQTLTGITRIGFSFFDEESRGKIDTFQPPEPTPDTNSTVITPFSTQAPKQPVLETPRALTGGTPYSNSKYKVRFNVPGGWSVGDNPVDPVFADVLKQMPEAICYFKYEQSLAGWARVSLLPAELEDKPLETILGEYQKQTSWKDGQTVIAEPFIKNFGDNKFIYLQTENTQMGKPMRFAVYDFMAGPALYEFTLIGTADTIDVMLSEFENSLPMFQIIGPLTEFYAKVQAGSAPAAATPSSASAPSGATNKSAEPAKRPINFNLIVIGILGLVGLAVLFIVIRYNSPKTTPGVRLPQSSLTTPAAFSSEPSVRRESSVPWEERRRLGWLNALLATIQKIFTKPYDFYLGMNTQDLASGSIYCLLMSVIGALVGIPGLILMKQFDPLALAIGILASVPAVFLFSAILHLTVFLMGGRGGLRGTIGVYLYTTAFSIFNIIPVLGSIASAIYGIRAIVSGYKAVHKFSTGKAVAAYVLPTMVLVIVPLLAAIAIPNLLRAKTAANDALATATLRSLSMASETYATSNTGRYPGSIQDLTNANPPYINRDYCSGELSGYRYHCEFSPQGYKIEAVPLATTSGSGTKSIVTGGILSE